MARNQSVKGNFNYNNIEKVNKNFMYKNLSRSNCYNCNFTNSNFNFVSFRGAHFKSCDFYGCSFKQAEFIGSNLKGSKFRTSSFENTVFDSVNLDGADFRDAKFKNVIFIFTDISKAKNLNINNENIKVFEEMPDIKISSSLEEALKNAMTNNFIKSSRVLDTKDGGINLLNVSILLENFKEDVLIKGLNIMQNKIDREFCTLSYLIRFLENYISQGLI